LLFVIAHNANKFALFTLVHADSFEAALQCLDKIDLPAAGSLEDALQFFDADIALWRDTDGALEWVRATATQLRLIPPTRAEATAAGIAIDERLLLAHTAIPSSIETLASSSASDDNEAGVPVAAAVAVQTEDESESAKNRSMFMGMYFTALDMAQE